MTKLYDISAKITNELPTIKITDEIIVTVNNRKSTILNLQAMIAQSERNAKEHPEETEGDNELIIMNKALSMMIGEKKTDEINALDLPINEYKTVYEAVLKVAQGIDIDTPSSQK